MNLNTVQHVKESESQYESEYSATCEGECMNGGHLSIEDTACSLNEMDLI